MATFISHSPEETAGLGEAWGREARPGWVIGLSGELGSGKTQLVKGIARGLGVPGRVQSPTFALVNEHAGGRLPLAHLDLYRLDNMEQIHGAGLGQYLFAPAGVTVVEWVERCPELSGAGPAPIRFRQVRLETLDETTRRIVYEDSGA
jgi:tRNA threonylcarbamoyladenosine biosynthesis protein TsaE